MGAQRGRPKKGTIGRLDEPIPYVITAKGEVLLEGLLRVCATCGIDQLPSGYRYGEEYYCEEHRPEHFMEDFRMLAAIQKETGAVFQEWDCYWTKWEMVGEYA